MKISTLQERLESIKKKHGDIPVCLDGVEIDEQWITFETDVHIGLPGEVFPLVVDLWRN